jgi:signal transduction histidine kinase
MLAQENNKKLWILGGLVKGFAAGLWFFLSSISPSLANEPILTLNHGQVQAPLGGYLSRAVGVPLTASIDEMAGEDNKFPFLHSPRLLSGGYSSSAHWYRFTVLRTGLSPQDWVLAMGAPVINDIRVYVPNADGGFVEHKLGDHIPPLVRPLATRSHALTLSLPADQPSTIYVRLVSNSVLMFSAELWQAEALIGHESAFSFLHGGYFGILAVVILVYSLFGLWLKDGALLGYVAYVATLFIMNIGINGFVPFIFPSHPYWLPDIIAGGGTLLSCIVPFLMWDRFLDMRKNLPRLHMVYMFAFFALLPGVAFVGTDYYSLFVTSYPVIAIITGYISEIIAVYIIWKNGFKLTLFLYIVAFIIATTAGTFRMLLVFGLIYSTFATEYSFQITSIVHVLLLSLALAYRIREIDRDRACAREEAVISARRAEEQRQFVGMLSHEFRAPLANIDKATQMIELTVKTMAGKAFEKLGVIRTSVKRLSGMVDSFLGAEALQHGNLALHRERVKLSEIIYAALLRHVHSGITSRLLLKIEPAELAADLDREMMETAISNLLDNALRYSPAGTSIAVKVKELKGGLAISVADKGAGMSREEIARAGKMYFRAQSAKGTKGTGLGLHMVKMIVAAHGGACQIESQLGKGATVTLLLPLRAEAKK